MSLIKLFIACGVIAVGAMSVEAADMEMKMVDKNCWVEIFADDNYDADDPHVKIQGPKEFATMKNLEGKDWANDIESVIVGSNASVHAYEDKDFKGTEITFAPGQRVPNLGKLDMANDIESMKISCQK
jgi:Beta/Gamma crystallin